VATLLVVVAACGSGDGGGAASPDSLTLKASSVLPPGQSGFFSAAGQLAGTLSGNPADYGAYVDDQRGLYWSFAAKPATLGERPGSAEVPKDGVEIFRDAHGVPIVYASTVRDLWYGVGYAVAHDRLFLMDSIRRFARGTLAELTGCGSVPADLQQRTLTYTNDEYRQFFDRLSPDAKDAVTGYIDGANAWRSRAIANPTELPAEYALLTTLPAEFTVTDALAPSM